MKNQFFLFSLMLAIPLAIFAQDDAVVEEAAVEFVLGQAKVNEVEKAFDDIMNKQA